MSKHILVLGHNTTNNYKYSIKLSLSRQSRKAIRLCEWRYFSLQAQQSMTYEYTHMWRLYHTYGSLTHVDRGHTMPHFCCCCYLAIRSFIGRSVRLIVISFSHFKLVSLRSTSFHAITLNPQVCRLNLVVVVVVVVVVL